MGFAVEPGCEREGVGDFGGFFDEAKKDNLGNIASGFWVRGDAAGHGVDERKVTVHEGAQSLPGWVAHVLFEELVIRLRHGLMRNRSSLGKANRNLEEKAVGALKLRVGAGQIKLRK